MPYTDPILEAIAECLSQAGSDSVEFQTDALQTLSSLTKLSSHHRHLLAQTPGAIPTLLALTKSNSHPVQTFALSILFNLSLNPNLKKPLAQLDTIHHLNSLILSPSSLQSGKLAASLICSLAMLDKNKAVFGVAGTVQAIITVLEKSYDILYEAHHLLSSLAELVQFHGNCTLAVRAGAVPVLIKILNGPHEDLWGSCLVILSLLLRFEEGVRAIRSVDGVVSLMVDGLKRGCFVSRESAAEILTRLFEGNEEMIVEALERPEFSALVADLSIRGSVKAREKAGVLMKMMMEADLECYLEDNPLLLR